VAILARLKGSKVLFHVQDLQPDAAVELGMMRRGPITSILYALERWTYRAAHSVSAISPGMLRKIEAKGVSPDKLLLFRNWADDAIVTPQARDTRFRKSWELGDRFVVLYAGNLGVKQGLTSVLQAAALLRDRPDIVFVIVGDGGEKQALMDFSRDHSLGNVQFRPLQPVTELSELLATSDISVVPQRRAVSDIVLPSKINNLLGSGRPLVVAADPGTDLHRAITETDCGLVVPPGDAQALAKAIIALCGSPETRARMSLNGRRLVESELSEDVVLGRFTTWLRTWVGLRRGESAHGSVPAGLDSMQSAPALAMRSEERDPVVTSIDPGVLGNGPDKLPA
jgi:colanic acid biosynthesis glycosyl transferase WcaI